MDGTAPVRTAIVLAGERPGGNALARAYGVASSLTLDLVGRPVIDWTLDALTDSRLARMIIVGPGDEAKQHPVVKAWLERTHVEQMAPAAGPALSALRGTEFACEWPLLLTAADHALLRSDLINGFCEQASKVAQSHSADLVVGLVDYSLVKQRFPDSKRTVLKFSSGGLCGSNLFLLVNQNSQNVLRMWSDLEALRKKPWRLALGIGQGIGHGIGIGIALRYLLGRLSVEEAFAALSARSGASVRYCLLSEPTLAVDVDSAADLKLAGEVLAATDKDVR